MIPENPCKEADSSIQLLITYSHSFGGTQGILQVPLIHAADAEKPEARDYYCNLACTVREYWLCISIHLLSYLHNTMQKTNASASGQLAFL